MHIFETMWLTLLGVGAHILAEPEDNIFPAALGLATGMLIKEFVWQFKDWRSRRRTMKAMRSDSTYRIGPESNLDPKRTKAPEAEQEGSRRDLGDSP